MFHLAGGQHKSTATFGTLNTFSRAQDRKSHHDYWVGGKIHERGIMSGIRGSVNLLRVAVRSQIVSKATLSHKPAKHHLSVGEQAIAMTAFFITILGPSGYVLAHLEDYKHHS
ncbi:cytochrome c oxidase subunit 8B, mitochondrial-like [Oncorhynchus keta]|uniref:cytochrome c oxidase subunit 8B, mitochondrial-like n=1 Tax=Oncorhynchus keta TaxID=8018 RepID=UPI0015F8D5C8|nr:cytochrome c oxidase subunit 8B, mitochondrial-like [Oncorhynchus keta]